MALSIGELIGYLRLDSTGFDAGITRAQREMGTAAGAAEKMGASVTSGEAALAGAGRQANVAASGAARFRAAQLSAVAAQERYNLVLAEGGASTGRLASAEAALIRANERVRATTPTFAPMIAGAAVASTAVTTLRERMVGVLATTAKLGVGLLALGGAFKVVELVKSASEFQRSLLLIQTQAGATSAEVAQLKPAVLALAGPLGTSPEKLSNSLYHAYSVTKNLSQALAIMKIAAEGAQVGNADLEETTNALTATVASGISGVKNYAQAQGALNAIVGAGDMKLSDLNKALGSGLLVTLKNYGVSLIDAGGALATFGDHNIRGALAATQLRLAVQALAVPARGGEKVLGELGLTSEGSAQELAKLGLRTGDLAKDLQSGGLNKAILDLKGHLDSAGISTAETGTVLTQVFGKKAGVGLQVLIGDLPRFEQKLKQVADGAGGFGAAWQATTQTASFAFKKLGVEVEVAGLTLADKLIPPLTQAAAWVGTNLPLAIGVLVRTFTPLAQLVGPVVGGAFKILGAAIGTVAGVLASIGHTLESHKALVTGVGAAVLTMWAAYKGFRLAVFAIQVIGNAFYVLRAKALAAGESMVAAAASASAMSIVGGAALGVIGVAVGIAAYAWQKHAKAVQESKQQVADFTAAIKEDSGALGENTLASVANALQKSGALDAARKLGLSLQDVTQATLGDSAALYRISAARDVYNAKLDSTTALLSSGTKAQSDAAAAALRVGGVLQNQQGEWVKVDTSVGGLNTNLNKAVDGYTNVTAAVGGTTAGIGKNTTAAQDNAKVLQYTVDSAGNLVGTMVSAASATDGTTTSMDAQKTSAELLKQSLDALNGVAVTWEQATNALSDAENTFVDGATQARQANDAGATSYDRNTRAGLKNRENLGALIEAAKTQAQATADNAAKTHDQTTALQIGNKQLQTNEDRIRAVAKVQGFNTQQTDVLITALGVLTTIKPQTTPAVKTKPALADVANLTAQINAIKQNKVPFLNADSQEAKDKVASLQAQIDALHGKSLVLDISVTGNRNPKLDYFGNPLGGSHGGTIRGYAGGGTVSGPGGPHSDSIFVPGPNRGFKLSNGEEVIQNPYASEFRPLLKAINAGKGPMLSKSLANGAGQNPTVNVTAPNVVVHVELDGEEIAARTGVHIAGGFKHLRNTAIYNS